MSFFNVNGLGAAYGRKRVLENISFSLEKGSLTGVLGANGCGKTTLLRSIGGMMPHEGSCELDGYMLEKLSPKRLSALCGYIPQRSGITIDISVLDVVLMGFNPRLKLLEYPSAQMRKTAMAAIGRVGLAGREDESYLQLSEGQKQLCVLARTIVGEAKLLLLDEPESALDFHHRHRMLEIVRQWIREDGRCALVTLHDPMLALNCCDRLILLSDGYEADSFCPKVDALERMEAGLGRIYGRVSLHRCRTRNGLDQLVMLKEDM